MENKENINEWQQIEQFPELSEWNMVVINENYLVGDQASSTNNELSLLQIVPTTVTDPEVDGTSSPLTVSSSEGETAPLDWRTFTNISASRGFGVSPLRGCASKGFVKEDNMKEEVTRWSINLP